VDELLWNLKDAGLYAQPVNPAKAQLMLFRRKCDQGIRPEIILSGVTLNYSQSIKYLGIYLDAKLSWREHITCKILNLKEGLRWHLGITTEGCLLALLRHSQTYSNIWSPCVDRTTQLTFVLTAELPSWQSVLR